MSRFGEFDRIAQQVGDNLAQPERIAAKLRRYIRMNVAPQLQPLIMGLLAGQVERSRDDLHQRKFRVLQLQPA
ncbi:hypothetical protein D3C73_1237830 [compost metagenome]